MRFPGLKALRKGPYAKIGTGVKFKGSAEIGNWTVIGNGCQIGKNASLGHWAKLQENVVLGDKVRVGSHTRIAAGTVIPEGMILADHSLYTPEGEYPMRASGSVMFCTPDYAVLRNYDTAWLVPFAGPMYGYSPCEADLDGNCRLMREFSKWKWAEETWLEQFRIADLPPLDEDRLNLARKLADTLFGARLPSDRGCNIPADAATIEQIQPHPEPG